MLLRSTIILYTSILNVTGVEGKRSRIRLELRPNPQHHKAMMNSRVWAFILLLCTTGVCVVLRGYASHYSQHRETSLCACEQCLTEDDPWFMQHFNKSVEPFLSEKSILSLEDFNWWKRLQKETRSFSYFNRTVERLFHMFPSSPDVTGPRPDRCRTCAVVGNSVNLKGSRYGPLIDFHDVVIRVNRGLTQGYEVDVGSRTTHRVMYPESATNLDNDTHLLLVPFKIKDLEWLIKVFHTAVLGRLYAPKKSHVKVNMDLVMVVNPAFIRYTHAWLQKKGNYPSTGFMALVLALHVCDEVHVFGYGADKDGNWSHYWEELKNKKFKTGGHPGYYEYEIIQKLAKQQKIQFYPGQ